MKEKYSWTENKWDDMWYHGRFDTVEECVRDAVENYGKEPGDQIVVGICEDYVPNVDADAVIDMAASDAYEECGDVANGWPRFINRKGYADADKLQEKLDKVFQEWIEETDQIPKFGHIVPLADMVTIPGNKEEHNDRSGTS
jgi:hypothetical protein